jgi:hypothetical protein
VLTKTCERCDSSPAPPESGLCRLCAAEGRLAQAEADRDRLAAELKEVQVHRRLILADNDRLAAELAEANRELAVAYRGRGQMEMDLAASQAENKRMRALLHLHETKGHPLRPDGWWCGSHGGLEGPHPTPLAALDAALANSAKHREAVAAALAPPPGEAK